MVGGAVGDALGYPVEFMSYDQILHKYGSGGITRYELNKEGVAEISDDTQMSLFTANGVLFCFTRYATHGILGAMLYSTMLVAVASYIVKWRWWCWVVSRFGLRNIRRICSACCF